MIFIARLFFNNNSGVNPMPFPVANNPFLPARSKNPIFATFDISQISSFTGEHQFLSNFYPTSVLYDGQTYPSSEHAYQAAKSLDPVMRNRIRQLRTPREAKALGKRIPLRPNWETLRIPTMRSILQNKFAPGSAVAQRLIDTAPNVLIEGNTWGDTYWGCVLSHGQWLGQNQLGLLLMEIRSQLTQEPQF
jgi:ribA/ribD-fused uncharacterized protein